MIKQLQLILGFYPRKLIKRFQAIPWYIRSKKEFTQQYKSRIVNFGEIKFYPCLLDKFEEGGSASGHYFHQDFFVASQIYKTNPRLHVDIGSRINGFVAYVACFREIEVLDIRSVTPILDNIKFTQADCMAENFEKNNYCDSVSSLHAIEHFGLGRYGDPIDIDGHLKGLNNIYNMLEIGGIFYFSVPIGPQRIEFNAHRVFSIRYLLNYFEEKYELESFSYVDDKGDIHKKILLTDQLIDSNCGCKYGCGIFILKKI